MKLVTVRSATFAVAFLGMISLFQNCGKYQFNSMAPALVANQNTVNNAPGTPGTGGVPSGTDTGTVCNPEIPGTCPPPNPGPTGSPGGNPSPSPTSTPSGNPGGGIGQSPTPTPTPVSNPGGGSGGSACKNGDDNEDGKCKCSEGDDNDDAVGDNNNQGKCSEGDDDDKEKQSQEYVICYLLSGNGKSDRLQETGRGPNVQLQFAQGGLPEDVCMPQSVCLVDVNNYLNQVGGTPNSCGTPTTGKTYVGSGWSEPCEHNKNIKHLDKAAIDALLQNMLLKCQ